MPAHNDYLVLDADSSQYGSVATALADQHVIVDGPPGTGKSQMIANVIAAGTAAGLVGPAGMDEQDLLRVPS
ncbi:hypothetical protein ACFVAV_35470 [Nocardia sp. NPDC057663]|uniref:hypothetical protein n=1 Tax=Nocardia sp. NPDC057663 TaxID=3346201 RepID=UPI00366E2B15